MICPAVRDENALPHEERYAPVIALAIAATVESTVCPSRPPVTPRPPATVTLTGAGFIRNTASTLPTRSTTAIVASAPRACASPTVCAMICCTSAAERKFAGERQFGAHGGEVESLDPAQPSTSDASKANARSARTWRLRNGTGFAGCPRMARIVEPVAEHAARGHLLLDRLGAGVALAAGLDRRDRDVARVERALDVVAVDALRLRVCPVAEPSLGHPAGRDPHRGDLPAGALALDLVAGVAHAHLEELGRDSRRLAARELQRPAALRVAGLADAAQQPLARDAERLLEAVLHAVQREVRVEVVHDVHRLRRLAVRHLARGHRGLELQAMAFPAVALHRDRLEIAARRVGLVAGAALEDDAAPGGRLHPRGIEVLRVREREVGVLLDTV